MNGASETEDGPGVDRADELDALVRQWESLQADVRAHKRQSHRRIVASMVLLAAVAGYALRSETEWLFAFVPPIVAVVFLLHMQETNHVHYRHWQCCRIEDRIATEHGVERFDWTRAFSPITLTDWTRPDGGSVWRSLPQVACAVGIYLVAFGVYVAFLVGAYPSAMAAVSAGPEWIPGAVVPGAYVAVTLSMILAGASNLRLRTRARREIAAAESPDPRVDRGIWRRWWSR